MQSVYFLCTNGVFCLYSSFWRWTHLVFCIFLIESDKILVVLMDKFRSWDVNPHSFPINTCLTLIDENRDVGADVCWPTLSKFQNIADIFLSCFLLDTACISKGDFILSAARCCGFVAVIMDTVLRSPKWKNYYLKLIIVGYKFAR